MIKLKGLNIQHFIDLSNHKWNQDLIYYDGPFLSIYDNSDNWDYQYIHLWVDCDDEWHRWLVFEIDYDDLENYKNGKISLRNLILNKSVNDVYIFYLADEYHRDEITLVRKEDIPQEYLPSEDSFWSEDLTKP